MVGELEERVDDTEVGDGAPCGHPAREERRSNAAEVRGPAAVT